MQNRKSSVGIFSHILAALFILCCSALSAVGASKTPADPPASLPSFDKSINTMRYDAVGDIRYSADEYLRYVPAALMLGLKAGGYESRSSWGRIAVSDAFSSVIMAASVNGLKYSVKRPRPDGSSYDSFPSGHTAAAFMTAAMLHEEYGWRSPWISFGGYAIASATGISRILNNRHWASDVIAGAVIGIASVKLGYFLADLVFKDKYLNPAYSAPSFGFENGRKYHDIGLYFGYRFALQGTDRTSYGILPGGAVTGMEVSIPITASEALKGTAGIAADLGTCSYSTADNRSFNTYGFMLGGYWKHPFAKILEADARIMAGYALPGNRNVSRTLGIKDGFAMSAGGGLAVAVGENFKVKAFALYGISDIMASCPVSHAVSLRASALFFW